MARGFLCLWETSFSDPLTLVAINDVCLSVCLSVIYWSWVHGTTSSKLGVLRPAQACAVFKNFFYWLPAFLEKLRNFM